MAKELPYFKFEPSEWLEGQIQVCSDEAIVCFVNLVSGYWLRLGCISYAFALQKYCRRNKLVLQELIDNEILKVEDDKIVIDFLDFQISEFSKISKKRSKAAASRWDNANAMQMHSKSNAIREEKRREDNKIPDYKKFISWFNERRTHYLKQPSNCILSNYDKSNLRELKNHYDSKDFERAIEAFCKDKWWVEQKQILPKYFLNPDNFTKFLNSCNPSASLAEKMRR